MIIGHQTQKYTWIKDSPRIEEHCSKKPDFLTIKNVTSIYELIKRKYW